MSDAPGNEQPVKQVELVAWHRPALGDGLYQITVRQQVSEPGNARVPAGTTFTTRQTFQVEGNRFSLVRVDDGDGLAVLVGDVCTAGIGTRWHSEQ